MAVEITVSHPAELHGEIMRLITEVGRPVYRTCVGHDTI